MLETERTNISRKRRTLWLPFLVVLAAVGCVEESTAPDWNVESAADARRDESSDAIGVHTADATSDAPVCDPANPPKCEGGNIWYRTTEAGCRSAQCACPDWARYDPEEGKCVDQLDERPRRDSCSSDSDCTSGYCDTVMLGEEGDGVCIPRCKVDEPECPDGWSCHVPGDVSGYCLPECSCGDGGGCREGERCQYERATAETMVCLNEARVSEDEFTCVDDGWCERACDRVSRCADEEGWDGTDCREMCDGPNEASCAYAATRWNGGPDCDAARSCLE